MAIYHCSIKIGSRGNGQSAVAAAAYRSGDKLIDNETGIVSDYTRKGGVEYSEISLCKNAPIEYNNRANLWNAVHEIEKTKNAQLWREFEVALPQELSREEQIETIREFVKGLNQQGMCADWSLHDKGDGNPHAHIMATMRSIEPNGKWAAKSRKVYDLDENGEKIFQKIDKTGRKQYKSHKEDYNNWNEKERVEEWRSKWAECCNKYLAAYEKIDYRSYERQGKKKTPTIHEGYKARKIEKNGKISERCEENRLIKKENIKSEHELEQTKQLKNELEQIENEIKALEKELKNFTDKEKETKGSAINERLQQLRARRNAYNVGGNSNGERTATNGEQTAPSRTASREYIERELERRKQAADGIQKTSLGSPETERADKIINEYQREQAERERAAQAAALKDRARKQAAEIKKSKKRGDFSL